MYCSMYCRKNYDLPNNLRRLLLSKSNLEENVANYFDEEEKENFPTC
jgi:hypothetical protein